MHENAGRPSDMFRFGRRDGELINHNVFSEYRFRVASFREFEQRLVKMDNDALCEAYNFFCEERQKERQKGSPSFADQKIIIEYLRVLLSLRECKHDCIWVTDVRSEIKQYWEMFPYLDSEKLAKCFALSSIDLPEL